MRARGVVVAEVRIEQAAQVPLIQDDDVIQTAAADRPDDALGVRILPRRPRGCRHIADDGMSGPTPTGLPGPEQSEALARPP